MAALPRNSGPVANEPLFLQVEAPAAWTFYLDGHQAGSFGDMRSGQHTLDVVQERLIPAELAKKPTLYVALRFTLGYAPLFKPVVVGTLAELELRKSKRIRAEIESKWVVWADYGFIWSAGIVLLILSMAEPKRGEMFWLGVAVVAPGTARLWDLVRVLQFPVPSLLHVAITTMPGIVHVLADLSRIEVLPEELKASIILFYSLACNVWVSGFTGSGKSRKTLGVKAQRKAFNTATRSITS